MKTYRYLFFLLMTASLSVMAGCSVLAGQINSATQTVETTVTPINLPTQLSQQIRVESQTCQVAELVPIQTDKPQGDLLAWSPVGHELAFVEPKNHYSGFYIGEIAIYDAGAKQVLFTSKDTAVFGDLTWSPDGSVLAFASLDQATGVYTVKTVDIANDLEEDLFGDAASTDEFASQKGILSWTSEPDLILTSVCGSDCVRLFQYNTVSKSLTPQQEIRYNENTSLLLVNETTSPDGNWTISIDNKDNTWLISAADNRISLLLAATELKEEKFSNDSQYLAIRTADKVIIYQLGCSTK